MNRHQLLRQIEQVERRIRKERSLRSLAACWLLALAAALSLLLAATWIDSTITWSWLIAPTAPAVGGVLLAAWRAKRSVDPVDVARRIEAAHPDLEERLVTAVQQQGHPETGRLGYLQTQVLQEAWEHGVTRDWRRAVPPGRLAAWRTANLALLGLLAFVGTALWSRWNGVGNEAGSRVAVVPVDPSAAYELTVEPGRASVERGDDLVVLAQFDGRLPGEVSLVWTDRQNNSQQIPLTKNLDDPVFAGEIPRVQRNLAYHIEYDDRRSEDFRVSVFEYPQLLQADAAVTFPDYTGLAEEVVEDTRQVSVVEGSTVRLICTMNKPLASARLVPAEGSAVELTPNGSASEVWTAPLEPEAEQRYRLELVDEEGRENKEPPEFSIDVIPNRRPELKLTFPGQDLQVSPLEELTLEATAWDDFGLQEHGLMYTVAGEEPKTVTLGESAAGQQEQSLRHLLALENLDVEPDRLVSYAFFADDYGPDGEIRRTFSDIYFAEVRPFEEIFRQGQQPPGGGGMQGGGQNARQIGELIRLQKDIVSATWKRSRREIGGSGESFREDVGVIETSQRAALEKVRELENKVEDSRSKSHLADAAEQMTQAAESLNEAAEKQRADLLPPALTAEHSAYQSLLALRAREHQVARSQGGGGGGGGGRSQQQLQQLELTNEENRYESERQASSRRENALDGEQLQTLSRLRELARRQSDVNEKLKELQLMLRQAKTEEKKEELRRRLKRLREEQQELLRDLDDLRNRMNQPNSQQRTAEARQQLDQTRSRVRQASEALEDGQVSRALSSGTRAERDLQKMRDEFRRRTSAQFAQTMQELQRETRDLSERQQQIAEQMQQLGEEQQSTLRNRDKPEELSRQLGEQKEKLENVMDDVQRVVRAAEETEPLVSRRLYEAVREMRAHQPEENLDRAARLLTRDKPEQAGRAEKQARQGIRELQRGVDEATRGIVSERQKALRQARETVRELADGIRKELARADQQIQRGDSPLRGGESPREASDSPQERSQQPGSQQSGPRRDDPQQSGSRQSGSQQNGSSNGRSPQGRSPSQDASRSSGSRGGSRPQSENRQPGLRGGRQPDGHSRTGPSPRTEGGSAGGPGRPLTGENFREWSDRMREVEEIVGDPELRAQAIRAREAARSVRAEFKRHSKEPQWDLVRTEILMPLFELEDRLAEEIARHRSDEALVPIDRDPVPRRFSEQVRQYYERLGSGK